MPLTFKTLFYIDISFNNFTIRALIDTGAFQSALPLHVLRSIQDLEKETPDKKAILDIKDAPKAYVKVATGAISKIIYHVTLKMTFFGTRI